MGAPCGVPFLCRRARFATGAASPVVLLDRPLPPRLHPAHHPPVTHPTGDALEQLGVRSLAEVVRPIRVHDLAVARARQPMRPLDRIVGASSRPIGVLLRGQVRLDHRRQHRQRRRLRHPVPQAECPRPDTSRVAGRDSHPPGDGALHGALQQSDCPCASLSAPPSRSPTPASARAETTSTPSSPRPSSRAPHRAPEFTIGNNDMENKLTLMPPPPPPPERQGSRWIWPACRLRPARGRRRWI